MSAAAILEALKGLAKGLDHPPRQYRDVPEMRSLLRSQP